MNFSAKDYRAHVGALDEAVTVAGAERVALIEEGSVHMSFHFQGCGPDWWDMGARGSCAYASLSEIQPVDLLNGRDPYVLRRSDVRTLNCWEIFFFPGVDKFHCNGDLPECYKNAVTQWLDHIRSPDGEGTSR